MNDKNKRWLVYLVVFLLVLNISALGTIIFLIYRPHHTFIPSGPNGPLGKKFEKELNLSDNQQKEFKELRKSFFQASKPVLDSLKLKREEIITSLSQNNPDTANLYKKADDLGRYHAELKRLAIRHYLDLQSKCTPDQRKNLLKLYRPMIESDRIGRGMPHRFRNGNKPDNNNSVKGQNE
jgi:Spy/CpxP family protein refolding chaperone